MKIIRAIVAGEQRPEVLAEYRDVRCHASTEEIIRALTGHYRHEHLFSLKQALELYDMYTLQLQACDAELERLYQQFEPLYQDPKENPKPGKTYRRRHEASYDLASYLFKLTGVDLTAIDGLRAMTVQTILSEVGLDMTKFKSAKHFASWLGLAPNNKISGGKRLKNKTVKVVNAAANAFRMAAQSLYQNKSALGAFFRRIRSKHGSPIAITATANKLARIFYTILKTKTPYRKESSQAYDQHYKHLHLKRLKQQAARHGFSLQPVNSS